MRAMRVRLRTLKVPFSSVESSHLHKSVSAASFVPLQASLTMSFITSSGHFWRGSSVRMREDGRMRLCKAIYMF